MIKFKATLAYENDTGQWSLVTAPAPGCSVCTDLQLAHILRQVAASLETPPTYLMQSNEVH